MKGSALTTGIYRQDYSQCRMKITKIITLHMRLSLCIDKLQEVYHDLEYGLPADWLENNNIPKPIYTAVWDCLQLLQDYETKYDLSSVDFYDILFSVDTRYSLKLIRFKSFIMMLIMSLTEQLDHSHE